MAVAPDSAADCDTCRLVRHLDPPSAANGVAWLGHSDPPSGCWTAAGKNNDSFWTAGPKWFPGNESLEPWDEGSLGQFELSVDHVGDGDGLMYRYSLVVDKGIDPVTLL